MFCMLFLFRGPHCPGICWRSADSAGPAAGAQGWSRTLVMSYWLRLRLYFCLAHHEAQPWTV